jgi:serine/threonine protein phosphatase PrpC
VYDGHGGEECSAFLQKRLHLEVSLSLARLAPQLKATATDAHDAITAAAAEGSSSSSSSSSSAHANGSSSGGGGSSSSSSEGAWAAFDELVMGALTEAFVATDGDFLASKGAAGSTASTVLVLGTRAYCANVGDSRTVLCRRGGHATALSDDHKPSREDEARRIKAAGGFIINKRVMGELAVSRAFGDAEFKKGISEILGEENVQDGEDEQPGTDLTKPLVIARVYGDEEVSS